MKNFITIILTCYFLFSCSSIDTKSPEFVVSVKYYDSLKIIKSEFFYESSTGKLRNFRPEEDIVNLDNDERRVLYAQYKKGRLSEKCWFRKDDKSTEKYFIKFKTSQTKSTTCLDSTNSSEFMRYNQFLSSVISRLQKTDSYKKRFPEEFIEY